MLGVCLSLIDDEEDKIIFENIYNKYKNRIYKIVYSILHNEQLAEDATSEVLLSIAKNFQTVHKLEYHKLDYYIVITSRNKAFDILKKEKDTINSKSFDNDFFLDNNNLSDYDKLFLEDCLSQLSDSDREIIYLKYSYGFNYKEISKALGIKTTIARKRVQYAKSRLKLLLGKEK